MTKEGEYIFCEGQKYKIAKARGLSTCSICACRPCREHDKCYASTCYKLIGPDHYLRK